MYRLVLCLFALTGFGLSTAWALLNRPEPPIAAVATAPELHAGSEAAAPRAATQRSQTTDESTLRLDPAQVTEGYSGTVEVRAVSDSRPSTTPTKARPVPPSGRFKATKDQLPAVAQALAVASDYGRALECMYAAGEGWKIIEFWDALPDYPGWKFQTRFQRDPDTMAAFLFEAFAQSSGVARQNIIFHVALALPERTCVPWLEGLRASTDAEDAEDATCALAFRGHESAIADFEFLARAPANVDCRIIADSSTHHDALATQGLRGLLRSYRCIEVLDCKPYFWRHSWAFGRGVGMRFPWADEYAQHSARQRTEIARRLLPHWIARFEGHPGSDDMAWRLCQDCTDRGQWLEAAGWASRCATFPDQDMTAHGVRALVTLAEMRLERWQISRLLDGSDFERNRTLLQYICLRRAAAHEGFATALRELAVVVSAERGGQLASCFAARWSPRPAVGLDSGIHALASDDQLRRQSPAPEASPAQGTGALLGNWKLTASFSNRDNTPQETRKRPSREAVAMSDERLARQFRLWETMAELERRRDGAGGDDKADLEYKLAAVYYHERDVIYPCYAAHDANSGLPEGPSTEWQPGDELDLDVPQRAVEFRLSFASLARAALEFTRLAEKHPHWPGRDKALFSAAMAHMKLADYRPFWYSVAYDVPQGVKLFERVVREHPESNLADDSQRAAGHWRRVRRDLFQ